jgi:glycosyltransferase involved in cell wall biosynthesis
MKILLVHNSYQQSGGEDAVVAAEAQLLQAHGHDIVSYFRFNDELRGGSRLGKVSAGVNTIWSSGSYSEIRDLLAHKKPQIAHFHNTFPLISPAAYFACQDAGIPVVQTLHNYRLLCPGATLFRNGKVCEDCLGRRIAWPAVLNSCYRDSAAATAATAAMLAVHHVLQTWQEKVDIYIALSDFSRNKFVQGGFPAERMVVKRNAVSSDPAPKDGQGHYALYVGRLTEEKGAHFLTSAWNSLDAEVPLMIAGDGPMRRVVDTEISQRQLKNVEVLGRLAPAEIIVWMRDARFLIFPSLWFEGFPMTIAEAFACGLPVIVSRLGAMAEIVEDHRTGLHFTPGDAEDLAAKVQWAWTHPAEMMEMGRAARAEYEAKYNAEENYRQLMSIYERALGDRPNSRTSIRAGEAIEYQEREEVFSIPCESKKGK